MIILLSVLAVLSTFFWYAYFYTLLYSIKKEVDLSVAALKLLVLISLGLVTCPLVFFRGIKPMYEKLILKKEQIQKDATS